MIKQRVVVSSGKFGSQFRNRLKECLFSVRLWNVFRERHLRALVEGPFLVKQIEPWIAFVVSQIAADTHDVEVTVAVLPQFGPRRHVFRPLQQMVQYGQQQSVQRDRHQRRIVVNLAQFMCSRQRLFKSQQHSLASGFAARDPRFVD